MNVRFASALAVLLLVAPSETLAGTKGASAAKSTKGFTEDEFRRYAAIISDRKNPATSLEVIVNSSGAAPYFNGLLKTFHIPGRVVIRSAQ